METVFTLEPQVFEKVINDIVNDLSNTENKTKFDIENDVLIAAKQDIMKLLTNYNFDTKEIANDFQGKTWDREKIKYFANLIDSKKSELLYATLARHNSKYGDTVIKFDWYLKLILGTSELNNLRYPLLQLLLNMVDGNGHQEKLLLDVNKEMLLKIINALESINNT